MKLSRACLLLVALSASAPRAAQAVDINYTITGLTAWNGAFFQQAQFDPTPDRPFQITFNLNDAPPPPTVLPSQRLNVTSDAVTFSGISPNSDPPRLSFTGVGSTEIGSIDFVPFTLDNPATHQGEDLKVGNGFAPQFWNFFDFSGPALFHYANGQATFETGTFDLTGQLTIINAPGPVTTPLADVVLTAQSAPVPEGASWLLAASAAAGVAGTYGVRRRRWRPAPT